ncbi:MAG: IS30 family transposase [Firmicutes bacterium]|nr:IS30 family transposase [Bacillota bacterium]MBE6140294.1 IS30 family transposase [Bacillota bacterium]
MSKTDNTIKTKKKQYRHLNEDDRVKIQSLIEQKDQNGKRLFNNTYIAYYIGVNKSTISRELKNRIKSKIVIRSGKITNKPYNATDAQNDYNFKRSLSKGEYKILKYTKMKDFIEEKIKKDKWAPDVIIGYMESHGYFEKDGFCKISVPTIYNAIRNQIIDVKLEDTRRMKYKPEYEYHNKKTLPESKLSYSIDNRPEEINKRIVFGHFELDTVIGTSRGKHECLMTLTERKTQFEIIFKLQYKSSEEVVNKFDQVKSFMKSNYNKVFKSLTTDNGTEFSDFLGIIKDSKTKIYFCHPYCSGEKGTNEKNNSIIRYFIPKKTLIENYSFDDINKIANWMNNYPRKKLGYKTPLEAFLEEFDDLRVINKIYKLQEKVNC